MNIQGCVPRFFKAHGSLILTILSGVGLVASVISAAKQAPKAEKELENELHWKIHHRVDEMMDEAEANGHGSEPEDWTDDEHYDLYCRAEQETSLTVMEKIKTAGPVYAPVILLSAFTLGCMAGAQILNTRQQAALVASMALLQKDFGAYRQEIRDEYGEEADQKALMESRKKVRVLEEEVKRLEGIKNVCTFGIATLPGVIFRSDMANIERAFLHFNRNVALKRSVDLEELYSFLGLPEEVWKHVPKVPDEDFGWNEYLNEVVFGCVFFDYFLHKIEADDGSEIYMIDFTIPPYRINGSTSDDTIDPDDYYEGYQPEEAKRLLKKGVDQVPMLIDSTTNHVWAPGLI